ncbi:WD40-repeat-containing domain protein [Dipodascopsis tothii]|uniref:WD40-repeat-containing domain protein n=1 Tax=Dipodascopsis tothii TaxID=44089 RepID=UPI0034CE6397
MFNIQHRTFQALGYARNPSFATGAGEFTGDVAAAERRGGRDMLDLRATKAQARALKRKRESKGDAHVLDGENAYKGPWAAYADPDSSSSSDDEPSSDDEAPAAAAAAEPAVPAPPVEKSTFHGSVERDYLGRTYMHVPRDLDVDLNKEPGEQSWYLPKRKIHTWPGHYKGVSALRFFPKHGHLLLSAGMDGKVKLWDCYHKRELLRSYVGHGKAVKDAYFTNDGTKFLSASYDATIKLWDTETGQCISRFGTGKTPNCVRFNPDDDKQDQFLAGMSDKKIVQFDTRTTEIVQEYDHHLGAVNSITFVDDNRRFMTTSDDKSIRVWEWQINVPIKFIADPQQHSMPTAALHPSGKYVAAQSMDNTILVFGATDRFRQNRKRVFRGHNCAGYGIEVNFSPDGRWLMSGDTGGYACFWDWKTTQLKSKFKAHDGCLVCIAAHPQESSKVVTGGLDGKICYWD